MKNMFQVGLLFDGGDADFFSRQTSSEPGVVTGINQEVQMKLEFGSEQPRGRPALCSHSEPSHPTLHYIETRIN